MLNPRSKKRVIDDCLKRLADGATIEECLQQYPKHYKELWPILQTAAALRQPRVKPSASADARIKAAMLVAYNENREIEKSPVSYLDSARYTGRQHKSNNNRRQVKMNNRSIFTQLAGAAIALIFVAAAGWFVYTNVNQIAQPNGTTETTGGVASETAGPTEVEPILAAPTPSATVGTGIGPDVEADGSDGPQTPSPDAPNNQLTVTWPSPDEKWVASASKVDSDGSRTVTLTVTDQSGTVHTPISKSEKLTMLSTEAYVFGWSSNSQYVYYAESGFADGCEVLPTFYINLSRLDVNTGATDLLSNDYLADVLLSPDGTQLAIMNTFWNNNYSESDLDNITVDIVDTLSAETTSQTKIFDKSEAFVGGTLNNLLHWSEDGSRLVAQLHDNPCPVLGGEQAYQLIDPAGESPLLLSSADLQLDDASVMLEKRVLTAEQLQLMDAANNCDYSIYLASKRITSQMCPESIGENTEEESENSRRPVSEYGIWSVTQMTEDLGGDLFKIQLILENQETGERFAPIDEVRESAMGFAAPVQLDWSVDGRYFYFANLLPIDGCEDLEVFNTLQRIDVTDGAIETVVSGEMADIKLSPDLQKIAVLSRSVEIIATEFDTITAEVLSTTTFDAKYVDGGAINKVHYSSDSTHLVAELNTMWCPVLGGDTDFWSVNESGKAIEVFSSRTIATDDQQNALLSVRRFEQNVLLLIDGRDSCEFDVNVETQEVAYTSCPTRLQ